MRHIYQTHGTCSQQITIDLSDDGIIQDVCFLGGCNGNLQGISSLVIGQPAERIIERLEGIRCGYKATSCPDQLAHALREALHSRQS